MLQTLKQKYNTISKWGVVDFLKVKRMIAQEEKFSQSKEPLTYYKVYKEKLPKTTSKYSVSILIPTRNEEYIQIIVSELSKSLKSTERLTFEIIVLNNFNKNISRNIFEKNIDISVIDCDFPFNFSKINNIGVSSSKYDTLWFLNDDIRLDHFSLKNLLSMLNIAHDPKVGAVGNILLYPDGKIQHGGISQRYWVGGAHIYRHQDPKVPNSFANLWVNDNHIIDAVTGASLMIEKNKFLIAGGFNEDLPIDFNDVQLCISLKKSKLSNVITSFVILHLESASRINNQNSIKDVDFVRTAKIFMKN